MVPYLISSHPGSTMAEAVELAEAVRDMGYMPEQVQDFYPTPSTMSTCMYYTGVDPRTMEPVYVARDPHEKAMQRALIQYRKPENYRLVREALERAGRRDLIGYDRHCLIRPVPPAGTAGRGKDARGGGKAGGGQTGAGKRSKRKAGAGAPQDRGGRPAPGGGRGPKHAPDAGRGDARGRNAGRHGGKGPAGAAPHGRNRAAQGREGARGGRRR